MCQLCRKCGSGNPDSTQRSASAGRATSARVAPLHPRDPTDGDLAEILRSAFDEAARGSPATRFPGLGCDRPSIAARWQRAARSARWRSTSGNRHGLQPLPVRSIRRVTASFAGVAKRYGVSVAICPSRRGNRKGVVEKVPPRNAGGASCAISWTALWAVDPSGDWAKAWVTELLGAGH